MTDKAFIKKLMKQIFDLFLEFLKISITALPVLIGRLFKLVNKRLRFSITFKITTVYTLILSIILFLTSACFFLGSMFITGNEAKNNLDKTIRFIAFYMNDASELPEDKIIKLAKDEELELSIFDKNKKVLLTTEKSAPAFMDKINTPDFDFSGSNEMIAYNKKVTLTQGTFYIQVRKALKAEAGRLAALFTVIFIVNIIALIITMSTGSRASKKMLKPVENMTKTAKAITAQALDRRLDVVDSHDELKDLAETFNEMLDRIQRSYEQQNQFVSDASHELRTPISVIQGYANLLHRWGKDDKQILEEAITAIKSESENMKELVEKLLFLARTDKNTQKIVKEEFFINELIDEIVKETRLIDPNHTIMCDRNDTSLLLADRKLIKQALRVFIDNSIKYTPHGGIIKLNSYLKGKNLILEIEDTGSGIAKEDLPFMFDRFYRCDKSRTKESGGTGLGLSIAKWIIGRHNGAIEVESALEKGTKIIMTLSIKG